MMPPPRVPNVSTSLFGGDGSSQANDEKEKAAATTSENVAISDDSEAEVSIQMGVKQAQAVAAAWTKKSLVLAYIGIFLVFFVASLQQQIANNLTPYVTSAFSKHALLSTTQIMSSIIGAVAKLPVAKIIDIWGRAEGYCLMVAMCTLGLTMMAACNSVEMYAAAQVFYWIGHNGMVYVLDVFLADTSSLKNRGWLFAFSTSPFIVTAWAGPAAAQKFNETTGWRWGFGVFCLVFPIISAPVVAIFMSSRRKAVDLGYLKKQPSDRTWWQSTIHYFEQFDVIGMLLLVAGFALILLPISLGSHMTLAWSSPTIISMFVVGGCSMVAFGIWERSFAKACLAPFHLLVNRMVVGACLCSTVMFVSFYCWDMYFVSYLQVVYNQSIQNAGYIANIYNIGGCFWAIIVGAIIRATGRFKYIALAFIPIQILGVGLMIYFRQPHTHIGWVILCQVIISFSGGTLMICEQISVMAAAAHSEIAVVLALQGLFSNLGGAIGQTLSGVIWSRTVPVYMEQALPESMKANVTEIYSSLPMQLEFKMGSPEREGIIYAYSVGMHRMLIAAISLLPLAIAAILMWKNLQLKHIKQVKGNVV